MLYNPWQVQFCRRVWWEASCSASSDWSQIWSLVLCNGNVGNEPYSVACQGSLPFFCMAKLMVVTSTAQINMSVVAWHSTITVYALVRFSGRTKLWISVMLFILYWEANKMVWILGHLFCMVIITRILMHFKEHFNVLLWLAVFQTYQGRLCKEMYHSRGHFHRQLKKKKLSNLWSLIGDSSFSKKHCSHCSQKVVLHKMLPNAPIGLDRKC